MYIAYSTNFPGDFGKAFFQATQFFVWVVLRQLRCLLDSMPGPQIFLSSFKTWFWANGRDQEEPVGHPRFRFRIRTYPLTKSSLLSRWLSFPQVGYVSVPWRVLLLLFFKVNAFDCQMFAGVTSRTTGGRGWNWCHEAKIQSTKQPRIFTHIFTNIRPKTHLSIQQRIFRYFCLRIGRGQVAPQQKSQRTGSKLNVQWRLDTVRLKLLHLELWNLLISSWSIWKVSRNILKIKQVMLLMLYCRLEGLWRFPYVQWSVLKIESEMLNPFIFI